MIPSTPIEIRHANISDLPAIVGLQNSYVEAGFVGMLRDKQFELEERRLWLSQFSNRSPYQLLIATDGQIIYGYSASIQYRSGGVFSRTVEISIYTSTEHHSKGMGSLLYAALFNELSKYDLHLAVVGIALPNEKSISLHRKFGFEEVGTFKEYAFFKDSYVSSLWMQKKL